MRPYLFGGTYLDLDHVLAITPSDKFSQVTLDMAFRTEPVYVNYWKAAQLEDFIAAWSAPRPVSACTHDWGYRTKTCRRCGQVANALQIGGLTGPVTELRCQHDWKDARNQVITEGEICLKCGTLRPGNRASDPKCVQPT